MRQTIIYVNKSIVAPQSSFYQDSFGGAPYGYDTFYNTLRTITTKIPSWTDSFATVKKSGRRLKPLAYTHTKTVNSFHQGNRQFYSRVGDKVWLSERRNGAMPFAFTPPSFLGVDADALRAAESKAVAKFLNKLKDSKFNGAQAFAESQQVHRMIGSFAVKTAEALFYLKKGKLRAAGEVVGLTVGKRAATRYSKKHHEAKSREDIDQMLSSGVLAIQYGVRPLIQDVIGAAELYAQKRVHDVINTARSNGSYQHRADWHAEPDEATKQNATYTVDVTVNYGCTFAKGSEVLHTLKQLGLTNPLLLAWELMPWSFVLDWILPVGDYLSSLDATLGLDFVDGYRSVKIVARESLYQHMAVSFPPSGNGTSGFEHSSSFNSREEFTREVLTSFPFPQLPRFKNPLSWEHALNGISLLAKFKKTVYLK